MEGSVSHASSRKRCADLAGRAPLRQIRDHSAAKNLITIQQALLRATPSRAGCLASLLGPILPVRTRMAGDLTAHHRGATPNQVSDTHLRQAHIHPRHDRRAILDSKHPTTPHDQPPNSITATRKLLTPYDTAGIGKLGKDDAEFARAKRDWIQRENDLRSAGWTIYRVSWRDYEDFAAFRAWAIKLLRPHQVAIPEHAEALWALPTEACDGPSRRFHTRSR